MANRRTNLRNAYESTLSATMDATTTAMTVTDATGLTAPCYLVIEPDSPTKREYVYISNISAPSMTASERYLTGSAAPSGIIHDAGSVVRMSAIAQHITDINDRHEAHTGSTSNPHAVTAGQAGAAAASHEGATGAAHGNASGAVAGFLTAADKTKLDGVATGATNATSHIANVSNPHAVTAAQAAAAPSSHVGGTGTQHGNATGAVAGFLTAADFTKLGGIATGAQVNPTAAAILAALITVDGAGSGLDADLLDGLSSAAFALASALTAHAATAHVQKVDQDQVQSTAALSLTPEAVRSTITFTGLSSGKTYMIFASAQAYTTGQAAGFSTYSRCAIGGNNGFLTANTAQGNGAISASSSHSRLVTGATSFTVQSLQWRDTGSVPSSVSTQLDAFLIEV